MFYELPLLMKTEFELSAGESEVPHGPIGFIGFLIKSWIAELTTEVTQKANSGTELSMSDFKATLVFYKSQRVLTHSFSVFQYECYLHDYIYASDVWWWSEMLILMTSLLFCWDMLFSILSGHMPI